MALFYILQLSNEKSSKIQSKQRKPPLCALPYTRGRTSHDLSNLFTLSNTCFYEVISMSKSAFKVLFINIKFSVLHQNELVLCLLVNI